MGQIWFKPNFEFGIFRIKSRKVENGRKMSKPFLFRFRIWCSEFRTDFEFVRKYEFDRIKCRKRYGSVRDISVPFSSLAASAEAHQTSAKRRDAGGVAR